jgi:uncharacterized protein (DUF849 family)
MSRRNAAIAILLSLAALISPLAKSNAAPHAQAAHPAANIAHLHVYRPHRGMNSSFAPSLFIDHAEVARITNGSCVTIKLTPGSHNIESDDKSSVISLDAKPGQDYFIRVDEIMGMPRSRGKLTMMSPEQGAPEYKLQKPLDDKHRIAKDIIEPNG